MKGADEEVFSGMGALISHGQRPCGQEAGMWLRALNFSSMALWARVSFVGPQLHDVYNGNNDLTASEQKSKPNAYECPGVAFGCDGYTNGYTKKPGHSF